MRLNDLIDVTQDLNIGSWILVSVCCYGIIVS